MRSSDIRDGGHGATKLRPIMTFGEGLALRLHRFKPNLVQQLGAICQFKLSNGELVLQQEERQDGRLLAPTYASGIVRRHRQPDTIEEIPHRESVPPPDELTSFERRRRFATHEVRTVTNGTFPSVKCVAPRRLHHCVHAVPHRLRLLNRDRPLRADGMRGEERHHSR